MVKELTAMSKDMDGKTQEEIVEMAKNKKIGQNLV